MFATVTYAKVTVQGIYQHYSWHLKFFKLPTIFVPCGCTLVGASLRNVSFYDPPFVVILIFGLIGSYCRGRKNIPDLRGWSWKVPRSTPEVWEVVWAAVRGEAGHILFMQLLERQSTVPGLALPQHKLFMLLLVPAGIWGWAPFPFSVELQTIMTRTLFKSLIIATSNVK